MSCFILTKDVDKNAFKFTIHISSGKWQLEGAEGWELRWSDINFWREALENF